MGRKLQQEIILLAAWGPAILLQLAHPLVARGIADHSAFRCERRGRLRRFHRTVQAMLRLSFGTAEDVRAVSSRINAIHDRVTGRLVDGAGVFPAGTPYSAHDPALLAWVHATLLDMNVRVYELFVGPLTAEEKDRYCAEASAMEGLLGVPPGRLPRSFGDLHTYMEAMYASGQIVVTDLARALALAVVDPPAPRLASPLLSLMRFTTIGLLPPTIREAYGFAWGSRHDAMLTLSARVIRRVLPLVPPVVRHWPAARRTGRRGDRDPHTGQSVHRGRESCSTGG